MVRVSVVIAPLPGVPIPLNPPSPPPCHISTLPQAHKFGSSSPTPLPIGPTEPQTGPQWSGYPSQLFARSLISVCGGSPFQFLRSCSSRSPPFSLATADPSSSSYLRGFPHHTLTDVLWWRVKRPTPKAGQELFLSLLCRGRCRKGREDESLSLGVSLSARLSSWLCMRGVESRVFGVVQEGRK